MNIMSNHPTCLDSQALEGAAPLVAEGGGRPHADLDSHKIRPLTKRAQNFYISDPVLAQFILEKISFHVAVFPFLSLPDQATH
jgi:hypothetical protein